MYWLLAAALAAEPEGATPPASAVVQAHILDRVAASVNDDIITLSELYEFGGPFIEERAGTEGVAGRKAAEREVLERLIARTLVDQEIDALKLDVTEQELDRTIDDIAQRNGLDRDSLRAELERQGMGWEMYRSQLKGDLRQMKFAQSVLRPRVNITEDELRDAYNRLGSNIPKLAKVQAIFLLFPADPAGKAAVLAKAKALSDQAIGGADFAKLSAENDEAGFGSQGGEMGSFAVGELVPELDRVVFGLQVGQVSAPIQVETGVFVVRLQDLESSAADFESVKGQLQEQVFEARMTEEQERWFQQARGKASIRILLPE